MMSQLVWCIQVLLIIHHNSRSAKPFNIIIIIVHIGCYHFISDKQHRSKVTKLSIPHGFLKLFCCIVDQHYGERLYVYNGIDVDTLSYCTAKSNCSSCLRYK